MTLFDLYLWREPRFCIDEKPVACRNAGLRLLALLALEGACERLWLADLLWETTSEKALHNLRMTLQHLRKSLGPHEGILKSRQQFLELDLEQVWVDLLHVPTGDYTQGFMSRHRTRGSEAWLEWADQTEQRLLAQHVAADQKLTSLRTEPQSQSVAAHAKSLAKTIGLQVLPCQWPTDIAEANAALHAYHFTNTVEAEGTARRLLMQHASGPTAAAALGILAKLALGQGEYLRGRKYAEQALLLHHEPCSEVAFTAAYANTLLGQHQRAEQIARSALQTLPAQDTPALLYSILARSHDWRQQHRAARHWHGLALQAAQAHDCPFILSQVISLLLWHFNITGEPQKSAELAQEGLHYGAPSLASHLTGSMGFTELIMGNWENACALFLRQSQNTNTTPAATGHTMSAYCLHHLGQEAEAETHLLAARELLDLTENGNVKYEWGVAALTLNASLWGVEAAQVVAGVQSNNPIPQDWYNETRERTLN